jgi:AcrR family transcriptional regulator
VEPQTDGPTATGAGAPGPGAESRDRVLAGAYECVARFGMAKTTVDDVAKASGVSRATIYRLFPGGRDQLLRETVGWEMNRFFARLAEAVDDAPDFATLVEQALIFAHRAVNDHEVLQKVLVTEPDVLLPLMTIEQHRVLRYITAYLRPPLQREADAGRLRPDLDLEAAADFVARMALSIMASPGSVDLSDPEQVRELVRNELLAGILVDPEI